MNGILALARDLVDDRRADYNITVFQAISLIVPAVTASLRTGGVGKTWGCLFMMAVSQ
jgi:hypothetical protein